MTGIMRGLTPDPMVRRLSIGLLTSAIAIAPMPMKAQEGSAERHRKANTEEIYRKATAPHHLSGANDTYSSKYIAEQSVTCILHNAILI